MAHTITPDYCWTSEQHCNLFKTLAETRLIVRAGGDGAAAAPEEARADWRIQCELRVFLSLVEAAPRGDCPKRSAVDCP